MLRTDVHQHLWSDALVAALTWRREPPLIRRSGHAWVLRLRDEPECHFDPADHDPQARRALLQRDGIERVLLCISGPLGIEALERAQAEPLLEAHNAPALELGGGVGVSGPRPSPTAASSTTPRPTACARSTRSCAASASTSSSTAPTGRSSTRRRRRCSGRPRARR